jgi:D-serine deaminase-like pyridoxal phosphate-dependent protein
VASPRWLEDLDIRRPTLILDKARVLSNIERMAAKAAVAGVRLRPHCKSHQSAEIAGWLGDCGVDALAVSSVDMARYFADSGWTDITIAFPLNVRELDRITSLAARTTLGVLVDSEAAVRALVDGVDGPVRVWIKVDTGYGRVGIPWDRQDRIVSLARKVRDHETLEFAGILTHAGHTYHQTSAEGIRRVHTDSVSALLEVKSVLARAGIGECRISLGDTPGCSVSDRFDGVDEIRPGNFVFYDLMQAQLGSCDPEDIAVAAACPVVGVYEERRQIVVHGGAAHLSMASLPARTRARVLGYLSSGAGTGLGHPDPESPVVSLSQEHGVIEVPERRLRSVSIGDVVLVFPVHSCLTCNLHDHYVTLDGGTIPRMRWRQQPQRRSGWSV